MTRGCSNNSAVPSVSAPAAHQHLRVQAWQKLAEAQPGAFTARAKWWEKGLVTADSWEDNARN